MGTIGMTYTPTHICNIIVKWIDLSCHSWLPMRRKLLSALNIHLRKKKKKTNIRNELATPYITVQGFIKSILFPGNPSIIQMLLHIQLCLVSKSTLLLHSSTTTRDSLFPLRHSDFESKGSLSPNWPIHAHKPNRSQLAFL